MKFIACGNKHCRSRDLDAVLEELEKRGNQIEYTGCMDLCHIENKLFSIEDLSIYQELEMGRIDDLLSNGVEDLKYQSNLNIIQKYGSDPMHLRTIKLFRWHLDKYDSFNQEEVVILIQEFSKKYDVKGLDLINPIMIALTKNTEGPELPDLIHMLGKDRVMGLLADYLQSKNDK